MLLKKTESGIRSWCVDAVQLLCLSVLKSRTQFVKVHRVEADHEICLCIVVRGIGRRRSHLPRLVFFLRASLIIVCSPFGSIPFEEINDIPPIIEELCPS